MDLLLPPKDPAERHITDDYMQQQYNRKHGVKQKSFAAGDMILSKYIETTMHLTGHLEKSSNVLGTPCTTKKKKPIRSHIDQIQARAPAKSNPDSQLPLDILMASFEMTPTEHTRTQPSLEIRPEFSAESPVSIPRRPSPKTTPYPKSRPLRKRAPPTYLRDYELRGRCWHIHKCVSSLYILIYILSCTTHIIYFDLLPSTMFYLKS